MIRRCFFVNPRFTKSVGHQQFQAHLRQQLRCKWANRLSDSLSRPWKNSWEWASEIGGDTSRWTTRERSAAGDDEWTSDLGRPQQRSRQTSQKRKCCSECQVSGDSSKYNNLDNETQLGFKFIWIYKYKFLNNVTAVTSFTSFVEPVICAVLILF